MKTTPLEVVLQSAVGRGSNRVHYMGSDARSGICNDYRREHQNRSLGREVRAAERDRVAVAPQPGTE